MKVKYGYAYGILNSVTDWTSGSASTVTGWLNSIQSGPSGGTSLQNQSYLYDLVGNVTQRQESTLGLTENFYYDNLYRLDYSQLNSATNLDLTYDAMGQDAITGRSCRRIRTSAIRG